MKKQLLLLSASTLLLIACGGGGSSSSSSLSSSSTGTSSSSSSSSINGVAGAIKALQGAKNYSFVQSSLSSSGEVSSSFNLTYTENYVFSDEEGKEWGYVKGGEGVYRISCDEKSSIKSSELLKNEEGEKIVSLWGSSLFSSMAELDLEEFVGEGNSHAISNKMNKLLLLRVMGFSSSSYVDLDTITITTDGAMGSLLFTVAFTKNVYTLALSSYLTAKDDKVESFLNGGGTYFTAAEDLSIARSLFEDDNFSRRVLSYDNPPVDQGTEHYLPQYFYGDYNTAGQAAGAFSGGYLGLSNKTYNNTLLNGTYMFYLVSGGTKVNLITTGAYNGLSDITSPGVLNYPSNMSLWDYLEYATKTGEGTYKVTRQSLVIDFAKNNQVYNLITSNKYVPLSFTITFSSILTTKARVFFELSYGLSLESSKAGSVQYEFFDFGYSNMDVVDKFIADNNLATAKE